MRLVSSTRRAGIAVALIGVLLGTSACGSPGPTAGTTPAIGHGDRHPTPSAEADRRYGQAPIPHPDVTYQPDVVLVGGGGDSVRSVGDDGLTWHIDPDAPQAEELAPGKVMFLTGRGVGRVLKLRAAGDDLAVTIGPVDITEVIRDGSFGSDRPIAFDRVVTYEAGEPFWADPDGEPTRTGPGAVGGRVPGRSGGFGAPPGTGGFGVSPTCCADGVGARFTHDSEGIRLAGTVKLLLTKPAGRFQLDIRDGSIRTAKLQIEGGAGLRVDLEGASAVGSEHNLNRRLAVPVDFTVPLGHFLGVPFSATVSQSLVVQTAFSAINGNIKAHGEYSFAGSLGFGYENGSFSVDGPRSLGVKSSLTDSISGVSVGVNGLVVAYHARFQVGIGAFGFTTGLYVGLTASVGITLGSAAGSPVALCRGTKLALTVAYGVGYSMPAPVVSVINFFLKAVKAKPIQRKGGFGSSANVFSRQEVVPDVPLCRT